MPDPVTSSANDNTVRPCGSSRKIRVLVVDDCEFMIAVLLRAFAGDEQIKVVGVARDGEEAIALASNLKPDVITMDIVMPRLDGISAIREIMSTAPVPIVVLSTVTSAQMGFEAVRAGALAILEKPAIARNDEEAEALALMVRTIKLMADVNVVTPPDAPQTAVSATTQWRVEASQPSRRRLPQIGTGTARVPRLIAVAASTGGPPALLRLFKDLPATYPIPILVVQHIAQGFGGGLVQWLGSLLKLQVVQARHGEMPREGAIYVAPDDRHLMVGTNGRMVLSQAAPIHSHCPSADLLFESVGECVPQRAVAIVLTGMGADGTQGLIKFKRSGGTCIAQDEASCIVYGMPKSAVDAGVVDRIMSLDQIAAHLRDIGRLAVAAAE